MTRPDADRRVLERVLHLLEQMEELQRRKVVALARRIRPGLTDEDIRNPHDFPDLDDPDWHYADGHLSGLQAAVMAVRAMRNDLGEATGSGEQASGEDEGSPATDGSGDER